MRGKLLAFGLWFAVAPALAAAPPSYHVVKTVPLGTPDKWDYLSFDPSSHRVYVAHGTEVTVVDGSSGAVLGRVQGLDGVHGIALLPNMGKGYSNSATLKQAVSFDLTALHPLKTIPVDEDADGVALDPVSGHVFMVHGDPATASVIDPATDTRLQTIALGGKPEFLVLDGAGHLFVNIEDKRQIVRIDTKTGKLTARWPISACDSPHGLAIDTQAHRLFASCVNKRMMIVDSETGKLVRTLPIGARTDAAAFDPVRKLAFSSNGEGTLSVIREESPDTFVSLGEIPTAPGARTMTLDPQSGRIYLVTADVAGTDPPKAPGKPARLRFKPGTVKLLMLDPQ